MILPERIRELSYASTYKENASFNSFLMDFEKCSPTLHNYLLKLGNSECHKVSSDSFLLFFEKCNSSFYKYVFNLGNAELNVTKYPLTVSNGLPKNAATPSITIC